MMTPKGFALYFFLFGGAPCSDDYHYCAATPVKEDVAIARGPGADDEADIAERASDAPRERRERRDRRDRKDRPPRCE